MTKNKPLKLLFGLSLLILIFVSGNYILSTTRPPKQTGTCEPCIIAPDSVQCIAYTLDSNTVGCSDSKDMLQTCEGPQEICVDNFTKERGTEIDGKPFNEQKTVILQLAATAVIMLSFVISLPLFIYGLIKKFKTSTTLFILAVLTLSIAYTAMFFLSISYA